MRRALHPETLSRFMSPRRSIFSMSRLPLRMEQQAQRGEATNIQKVRFGRAPQRLRYGPSPRLMWRIIIDNSITGAFLCQSLRYSFLLGPMIRSCLSLWRERRWRIYQRRPIQRERKKSHSSYRFLAQRSSFNHSRIVEEIRNGRSL